MSKTFFKDLLERVFWTALQAGLGVITVEQFDIPKAWVPVIAFGLAIIKGFVAKNIGDPDSASTVPSVPPVDNPPEA
jgi:hypothetical protein